ncbi:hypothetical protein ACS0TY_020028 [Phlomoides rotata]
MVSKGLAKGCGMFNGLFVSLSGLARGWPGVGTRLAKYFSGLTQDCGMYKDFLGLTSGWHKIGKGWQGVGTRLTKYFSGLAQGCGMFKNFLGLTSGWHGVGTRLAKYKDLFVRLVGLTRGWSKVAILNGITMGGGAGISVPGTFRVATDKTIFATPEALIGFHPDGGASFYLSRLPGYLGEYLGMTGDRLNGAEMMSCWLATHYTHTTKLPLVEKVLENLVTSDASIVGTCLQSLRDPIHQHQTSLLHRVETLDKCFSHKTVEDIIESLEYEATQKNDQWCASTLKKLKEVAPLSLKVSLRSIREGRKQTLEQCLIREYRMTVQAMSKKITSDFYDVLPPSSYEFSVFCLRVD